MVMPEAHSPMTDYSYILFNQTPQQLRRIGARGGKATARKRRTRLPSTPPAPPQPGAVQATRTPTVADAIALLNAQFPWLSGAEAPPTSRRPRRA